MQSAVLFFDLAAGLLPPAIFKHFQILPLLTFKAMKGAVNMVDSLTCSTLNDQKIHYPVGIFHCNEE